MSAADFASEAEMVATWLLTVTDRQRQDWTVYPETAGWDVLLVHSDGYQLGIEAKLSLNAKVLDQALSGQHSYWDVTGPDYRAVLVPAGKVQLHMGRIAKALGLRVMTVRPAEPHSYRFAELPDESSAYDAWPNWCPGERCKLPDYIPDVEAGHKSPLMLTPWKVKAIKLMVLLDRRGTVHRSDMKALQISPTRWTDRYNGFLAATVGGYIRCDATPDLRAQHPVNYAEIEADFDNWNPYARWDAAA